MYIKIILFVISVLFLSKGNALLVEYKFNGNTMDSSGNNYHAVANNIEFTKDRFGEDNSAAYLNGENSIIYSEANYFEDYGKATVSLWIKPDTLGINQTLFYHGCGNDYELSMKLKQDSTFGIMYNHYNWNTAVKVPDAKHWMMVTWQWEKLSTNYFMQRIFVNGVKADSVYFNSYEPPVDDYFYYWGGKGNSNFACLWSTGPEYFKGSIDDAHVYNYLLTEEELLNLFQQGEWQDTYAVDVCVGSGWNIVSAPYDPVPNEPDSIYQNAASNLFGFDNGYHHINYQVPGHGYWIKYMEADTFSFRGSNLFRDTIALNEGWNLIGLFDENVPVENIETEPSGLLSSFFFGFNIFYSIVDTLRVGEGYWVNSAYTGKMFVADNKKSFKTKMPKQITLSDKSGIRNIFYFENDKLIDLPPAPPGGKDLPMIKESGVSSYIISIESSNSHVTLYNGYNDFNISYISSSGNVVENVKKGESITIYSLHSSIEIFTGVEDRKETDVSLYPTPFNNSTTLTIIPNHTEKCKLKVYNLIGEVVLQKDLSLVDGREESINLNFNLLSNGIYFVNLSGKTFTKTIKTVYLK